MTAVIATIPVGSYPDSVAFAGRHGRGRHSHAYVANSQDGTVSVINTVTNTVTATIHGIDGPQIVKSSRNGAHAYVLRSGGVSVIDTATNTVTTNISHGVGNAFGMGLSPDGAHIYVTEFGDTVSVIDLATHTVTSTVTVGETPISVGFSPDGAHAYVPNGGSDTVSVIDTATNTVTTTIPIGGAGDSRPTPASVEVSPDGARAYVANSFYKAANGTVSVIDTATNTVTATIPVGSTPEVVAVSPDGARVYVTNYWDGVTEVNGKIVSWGPGTVSEIDTATNTVTTTMTVGRLPRGVAVSPDSTRAYVTNTADNTVSVISTEPVVSSPSQKLIGGLIGAVDRDGGGWFVIGNTFIPIPPRSPFLSVMAQAAAAHVGQAIDNPKLGKDIRNLR
jgi:YVTN family beta-propeller protein